MTVTERPASLNISKASLKRRKSSLASRTAQRINEVKYVEALLWIVAAVLGSAITVCHVVPLLADSWIYVIEPRPVNVTNEFGEFMDVAFEYSMGYFRICRIHRRNVTLFEYIADLEMHIADDELHLQCHWNPFFTGSDLSDFSLATAGIQERLGVPASLYLLGSIICFVAFYFGTIGFAERDCRTLLASMIYTCGGFFILVSVLQFICIVDDEMGHRMKPTAFGEASKYSYRYGYSFYFSSLSFLPLQMCICFHAFLYFRRFPNAVDTMKIVPGLQQRINEVERVFLGAENTPDASRSDSPSSAGTSRKCSISLTSEDNEQPYTRRVRTCIFADAV